LSERIDPVSGIRIEAAGPTRRLQPVTRERDRERGGSPPRDEQEERPDPDEEDGGPHVDVLA
jgi:hypothetical protein